MKINKIKTALVKDPTRESNSLGKLKTVLEKLSDYSPIDATQALNSVDLQNLLGKPGPDRITFLDTFWIEKYEVPFEATWLEWNLVLVESAPSAAASEILAEWQNHISFLSLPQIANSELPRVVQLTLAPNRYPGVTMLGDRGSEVFFEKILSLGEVGQKVDRIQIMLEKQQPKLAQQFFNFRQLSYSILYQGFIASSATSKVLPVVDFQCLANPERLVFAARFKAPEGSLAKWREDILGQKNLLWRNLHLSADLLVLTEIKNKKELEVKALLSRDADFSGSKAKSLVAQCISEYRAEAGPEEIQRASKFLPLDVLTSEAAKPDRGEVAAIEIIDQGISQENALLQLKLRADLLEKENMNLQELIKKKTQLIAGLNQQVILAQSDVKKNQNSQAREMQRLRLAEEKAKSEIHEITKKLTRLQQKVDEEKNSNARPAEAIEPQPDFEKDLKQAEYANRQAEAKLRELTEKNDHQNEMVTNLRKENRGLSLSASELKASILKLEKKLLQKEREELERKNATSASLQPTPESTTAPSENESAEKVKEVQRLLLDSQGKEQALDKEVKRLTIKLETLEKNAKVQAQIQKKQSEAAEKAVEEAKRQKSEAMKKLEERELATKKKLEETNEAERKFRSKIEELTASLTEAKKRVA